MPAHGFFWLLLSEEAPPPEWHMEHLPATELPVLVLPHGLATLAANVDDAGAPKVVRRTLEQYAREVLPVFMAQRRWFAQKAGEIEQLEIGLSSPWREGDGAMAVVDRQRPQ